jgi:hypothetical protein
VIGAAAGVFALAGGQIAQALLGSSYSSEVGAELGRLVVVLSVWAVVSVGVSVTFPLVFVAGRGRALPLIAVGAVLLQLALAFAGQGLFGLDGLAGLHALAPTATGLALAAVTVAAGTVLAFLVPALLLPAVAAAACGLCFYAALVAIVRPPGLRAAWRYLRALA